MAMIVGAMIVPLPGWALDIGIAVNLAAALSLLVAALYAKDALKVASFPTLLLVTTLFRLAMNVSSTRLALSEGHAGEIIDAFGEFVVRGDYVVGAVVFAILTLVQFLVVAKGAERVAEVSARFTLDAMPGKQMSIDADLRAGAIDQATARTRRRDLERESQMFGAMDGAMKFVKGDVIAGLVITLVNLIGGIAIGVLQNGMTAGEAASTYALIAIGDGLVSQIPSLCIAVAAGLVVTRVGSENEDASLGSDIGAQFFGQWKALLVVAGLCLALASMPGMPHFTFIAIASLFGLAGLALRKSAAAPKTADKAGAVKPGDAKAPNAAQPSKPAELPLGVSPLLLDLSAELSQMAAEDGARFVNEDLARLRDRLFYELGIKVPGIRVRAGAPLPPFGYVLQIDEVPCGKGLINPAKLYASAQPVDLAGLGVQCEPTQDPITGRPIAVVPASAKDVLDAAGIATRSGRELLCEHLFLLLRKRAWTLLGVQELQALLDGIEKQSPSLVREALTKVPLPLMTEVFKKLLREHVSVRNLRLILEALVSPMTEGDANMLAERCRQALHRQLTHQYTGGGPLYAYLVDPQIEEAIRVAGPALAVAPEHATGIVEAARRIAARGRAVLLASPDVRRGLRKLLEGALPEVAVLTFVELDADLQVRPVGRLAIS
ncbi:MAG: flagellar biosynthesis protein FlhA [Myxococcaceae bacterium]